jgi:hypothetical protein
MQQEQKRSLKGGDFAKNAKFTNYQGCITVRYATDAASNMIIIARWLSIVLE